MDTITKYKVVLTIQVDHCTEMPCILAGKTELLAN